MKSNILLCLLFFFPIILFAQSPGGIATNNTLWLRSDVGVTSSTSIVSQWQELSGAGITGNFTVQSLNGTTNTQTGPTVIDGGINFNPYLRFDGITNSLSSINIFAGTSLVSNSNITVFQVFNLKGGIVWLKWETDQVGSSGRLGFENSGGNIRFDFPKAVPASAGQNVGTINVLNQHSLSTVFADATSSINRLNGADNNTIAIPGPGDFASVTDKIVLGNENLINLPAQIDLAEVIIYSSTLSATERNKIESYLAVKYGFTLNQAAANNNDYTSANGTIIWNRATNAGYGNDITGIGRDDASGLSQKQSRSVNNNSLITLYNGNYPGGNFPLLNASNTNSFSNNGTFLITGDNGLPLTVDQCFFNGKAQRMQRVWKASNTNAGTITIAVDQSAVAATIKNLIVSADPNFPPASTTIIPLTAANGKLFTSLTLNHNDYFSFVTDTISVNMVVTQPICTNPNSGAVVTTVTGGNPPFGYAWAPSGQTTPNLTNANATTHTLTISQGTCQASYPVTLSAAAAPAAPVVNAVSVCSGNAATLNVQSPVAAQTYNWYSTATGGVSIATGTSFTTPGLTTATTYYVETVNGSCTSIRTAVPVSITTVTDPVVNAVTVCTGNQASLTVSNPQPTQTYTWYAAATGGTALSTGTTYNTNAINTNTTFYVEAENNGCINPRVPVTVTVQVVQLPQATGATVCPGDPATLNITNLVPGITYNWYDAPNAGTLLGTGTSITIPSVPSATDYYVEASNGSCINGRTVVTVSMTPPLITPVVSAGSISQSAVTFSWQPINGATGYQVSVDGGAYGIPSSGPTGLSHILTGLNYSQTVSINVIALNSTAGCGNSAPGFAQATTYGSGFYMPSAFTPNTDQLNNTIKPQIPGGSQMVYFTVFNRWGQKVFSTRINGFGWDGTWNGKSQPDGTYVWICRYIFTNGRIIDERGSFLLLH